MLFLLLLLLLLSRRRPQVCVDVEGGEEVEHGGAVEEAPEAKVVMPEPVSGVNHVDAKLKNRTIQLEYHTVCQGLFLSHF